MTTLDFRDKCQSMQVGTSTYLRRLLVAALACAALSACSRDTDPRLLNLEGNQDGPDEFAILPSKPLTMPESLASLPAPTPGGANRTDPTPQADAIAALGGRPELLTRGGADAGLVNYASRFGRSATIRTELAADDLEFRRRNDGRFFERLFNTNTYFRAYERFELDQRRELERFRAAGVRTPAVPPEPQ